MRNRQAEIRQKGFAIARTSFEDDYSKMRVGLKILEDAVVDLNQFKRINPNCTKEKVLKALHDHQYETLADISNTFYEVSGIYQRLCKYLAYLYKYDWYVIPFVMMNDNENINEEKLLKDFSNLLNYLDDSNIKKIFGDISLKVVKNGRYYGYLIPEKHGLNIQELPPKYCRTRFQINGFPVIEFNLKFFDDKFPDLQYRARVLKNFPPEFQKAYVLYKKGKLVPDYQGDTNGWYLLDPAYAFKINCGDSDIPMLANVIPQIIDLGEAQALDRKKVMQKLLKVVIQKLPLDKNGDLIFDVDEAADIHANAVAMLQRAVGVDVLTTFADVEVEDLADDNSSTTTDDLERVERTVYNESGVARNLFNSDSNLALEKSILDDEASIHTLIQQYEALMNKVVNLITSKNKKYNYKFQFLDTTIYNYKDLSKMYKEQVQIGYSKMLPQIALGHSQSEILATIHFENDILHLSEIMLPPMSTNTMNAEVLHQVQGEKSTADTEKKSQNQQAQPVNTEEKSAGRPEKDDSEKSDKTIANRESM